MAYIINGARNVFVSHPRLVRIRNSGKPMEILVAESDDLRAAATRKLWIRFVSLDSGGPFERTLVTYDGFLSESYSALEERTFDAIDPAVAQYVRGTTFAPAGHGRIVPWAEGSGNEAPGAEPFVIQWLAKSGSEEIAGVVMARSETEAARLCEFISTERLLRDRLVYIGRTATDGNPGHVQITRLHGLLKFPLR